MHGAINCTARNRAGRGGLFLLQQSNPGCPPFKVLCRGFGVVYYMHGSCIQLSSFAACRRVCISCRLHCLEHACTES
jgi:hypothetical protein